MRPADQADSLEQRLAILRAIIVAVEVLARSDRKSAELALDIALRSATRNARKV